MKILLILSALLVFGCTSKPKEPISPDKQRRTHPAGPHRPKRMVCNRKTAVVAVIDTGLQTSRVPEQNNICHFGHRDFTKLQTFNRLKGVEDNIPTDEHGHGTNVAGIIQDNAGDANYCILVLKYFSPNSPNEDDLSNTIRAIKYATDIGVKYINYSAGGTHFSRVEAMVIKNFIDKGGVFIAAAGNERANIDQHPYYPALEDSRVIRVGSIETDGSIASYSNYGKLVTRWEHGSNVKGFGITFSGTSQATAIATGRIIKEKECEK